ncbi:outer membrane efflux protein [Acidithiobacillus ferrivorans SS3]|uniref:Protein CyaE n=1 Tax=Acidithiobacillus ferrivorans SS3 TaxID=743299 RepID=G0JRD0_9PROT|nr:TolC family protein [Acidithiobacillus ferrivorans]AEM46435.1 outer membrane efflux protein [Acidithiobacillus ferrivorans SS3]MBU2849840.1 TolC family protein [Acidithiobacillus ferrivorans]
MPPKALLLAVCTVFCVAQGGLAQAGVGAWLADPLDTDSGLSASPAQPWTTQATLPDLPKLQGLSVEEQAQIWTLPQLTAYALAHNPQTAAAWDGLRAQAASLGMAKSAWLPSLSLNTNFSRRQAASTAGFTVPARNSANPNLTLSYTLWDFGLRAAKVDAARAQEWVAGFTQNQNIQTVAFSVAQAYYQLLGNQSLVLADEKTVAENQKNLEAAEVLHRAGQATIGALYQARAAMAQAQSTLAAQRQTVRSSEGLLASTLGLSPQTTLKITSLKLGQEPPQLHSAAKTLMHAALTANPTLQQARAQVAVAQANVRSAEASGLPSLGVNSSYGYLYQGGFRPGDTWTVGFTLTVPLFTGFNTHYQIRQTQALRDQAQSNLAASRNSTEATVWQDFHNFQGAIAAYPGAQSGLENAGKALEVVQAQYRVGQATIQDVLLAESTLAQARYTLIQNLVNSYVALAQLSQAVGIPLGENAP